MGNTREGLTAHVEELLRHVFGPRTRPRHKPAELELTLGQLECLHAISHLDAPSMSDLSLELGLPPSSVTGIVDRLVAAGKVQRDSDPDDRRVVRVSLTAQGQRDRDRHRRLRRERLAALLAALEDEQLRELDAALQVLAEAADRRAPE